MRLYFCKVTGGFFFIQIIGKLVRLPASVTFKPKFIIVWAAASGNGYGYAV